MKTTQHGGILIMVLVLIVVMVVIMMAGSALISSRYHQTINQSQREQAYDLAEAGVHYSLWLLNVVGELPAQLTPIIDHAITDPETQKQIGTFTVTFETATNGDIRTVKVTSIGKDADLTTVDQKIEATLVSSKGGVFRVKNWNKVL